MKKYTKKCIQSRRNKIQTFIKTNQKRKNINLRQILPKVQGTVAESLTRQNLREHIRDIMIFKNLDIRNFSSKLTCLFPNSLVSHLQ